METTTNYKIYWSNSQLWYIINSGNIITAYYNKNLKPCNRVPYPNVANAVKSAGGLDAFRARLITPEEAEPRLSALAAQKAERDAQKAVDWAKAEADAAAARLRLAEAEKAGPIAPTENSIRDLLLSVQHNCAWPLPQFTVGYSATAYDCDGKIAAAAKFAKPVLINGLFVRCVVLGAPRGYLEKYTRI